MNKRLRTAVMASGKGSNLEVIISASRQGMCPVDIALVLSDRPEAGALEIARQAGIKTLHLNPKSFPDRASFDAACAEHIEDAGCEWIVLAGYMRILSSHFVRRFSGRILNIHPSLLPAFPGAHAVEDALAYGVKVTGCTVHLVDEVLDGGPILAQAVVPVHEEDDRDTLHARIQEQEHRLYPETLRRIAETGFTLEGRLVRWNRKN